MRPEILFPLFARLASLPGVGPKTEKLLARVAEGPRVVDLLWLLPNAVVDRSLKTTIAKAPEEGIVTLTLTVDRHQRPRGSRAPYRVLCHDETSFVSLVFFHADERYLARALPVGATRLVSGRLERFQERPQIDSPGLHLGACGGRQPANLRADLSLDCRAFQQSLEPRSKFGSGPNAGAS